MRASEAPARHKDAPAGIETCFDVAFAAELSLREKQIQQSYRPIIGIHKWFARRPGTVFRNLLLAEFCGGEKPREAFWKPHAFQGVIGDPFMGGGTPIYEANRLGFHVVGCDINPMAWWIVRQSLTPLDVRAFEDVAESVARDVARDVASYYTTRCAHCGGEADVKYFLWVKTAMCPACGVENDLFPGYRLAEAELHPRHVLVCSQCGALNEYDKPPRRAYPGRCASCEGAVHLEGNVERKAVTCRGCSTRFSFAGLNAEPPKHRAWAIEYHCAGCYADHPGRLFKAPDRDDHARYDHAREMLLRVGATLPIPIDEIPRGDETDRLHRWGYRRYRETFNERQLLGLGLLLARIQRVGDRRVRHALLTVFSDTLRYQNMLCRYDTYALKCQDIFRVHGFPVGLVQCENNVLGIEGVGSGSFRHFVKKFVRAKAYCAAPFETRHSPRGKDAVPITGETIEADIVDQFPSGSRRKKALLVAGPSQQVPLNEGTLDGVFTDPPYFDNVQYAELMDYCFVWLRAALGAEVAEFRPLSTRSPDELTGNETLGRGAEHFTSGLSEVFSHFACALRPGAPFVFTYHHNDPDAYMPLVVAMLDAGLTCTATLSAVAEMSASLHIAGTASSVLDSVFVCRKFPDRARERSPQIALPLNIRAECERALASDAAQMRQAGVRLTTGDLRCLLAGHIARLAMCALRPTWSTSGAVRDRMEAGRRVLRQFVAIVDGERVIAKLTASSVSKETRP